MVLVEARLGKKDSLETRSQRKMPCIAQGQEVAVEVQRKPWPNCTDNIIL